MYVDTTKTTSAATVALANNTSNVRIGMRAGGTNYGGIRALIDEVSIFEASFTDDNVEYMYNSGAPGSAQQYPFTASTTGKKIWGVTASKIWGLTPAKIVGV